MLDEHFYREQILDHYKAPRNRGSLESPDAHAEGQNPLCGDELAIDLQLDGDRISDVRFHGQGCAISQAATSMLTERVKGLRAGEVVDLDRDDVVEMLGIPITPVRLKCAMLGLGVLRVALHRSLGTPLPDGWEGSGEISWD
jgi:nitrogen fixation NifU-like protein